MPRIRFNMIRWFGIPSGRFGPVLVRQGRPMGSLQAQRYSVLSMRKGLA